MRFQPTVHIDNAQLAALIAGDLKLQRGQWIQLAWLEGQKSRFTGVSRAGVVWASHTHKGGHAHFKASCKAFRRLVSKAS